MDEGAGILAAFAERAEARGVDHLEIVGRWPDVADQAPKVDVVVSHNVLYNVADVVPFLQAMTDHARARVVVELTEHHPVAWMNPYWEHFHELQRPQRPTADDAPTWYMSWATTCRWSGGSGEGVAGPTSSSSTWCGAGCASDSTATRRSAPSSPASPRRTSARR